MKVKKYIVVILLCVLCVCSLFTACELFGGQGNETPSGDNQGNTNNDNNNNQNPPDGWEDGNNNPVTPDPTDPDFVPDIDKTYIINPIVDNNYDGINRYIGKYEFGESDFVFVPNGRQYKDVVGASSQNGKYNFTSLAYLQEGAEMVAHDLGSSVFRMALSPDYESIYSLNTAHSDELYTMSDLAKTSAYSKVLGNSDLKTLIIDAQEFNTFTLDAVVTDNRDPNWFYRQYLNVTNEFYGLSKYLLQTYGNKDKTFILTTTDGDNVFGVLYDQCTNYTQRQALIETYYRYLNARQDGINKAVAEFPSAKAKVYGCIEVSHISSDIQGVTSRPRLVDVVIPYTKADLYSFADSYTVYGEKQLTDELNYLLSKVPNPNKDFEGKKNIILGKVAYASNSYGGDQQQYLACRNTIKEAVEYGVQYVIYDSYFCTTRTDTSLEDRPTNGNMQGCWLIKPDGSLTPMFWYLKGMNDNLNYLSKIPQIKIDAKI